MGITDFELDLQQARSGIIMPLIAGTEKHQRYIKIGTKRYLADVSALVHLPAIQKGIHMSRNVEAINKIIEKESFNEGNLLDIPKELVTELLQFHPYSQTCETEIKIKWEFLTVSPSSKKKTFEPAMLSLWAIGNRNSNGNIVFAFRYGLELEGISACPCGQIMMKAYCKKILNNTKLFNAKQVETILDVIPAGTHNQRCKMSISLNSPILIKIPPFMLFQAINNSFSAKTYSLLKRTDEFSVILNSLLKPKFVEDSVREATINIMAVLPENLPSETTICISQENYESIHKHNAIAKTEISLKELRELNQI